MGKKVRVEIFKEIFPMLKTDAAIDLMGSVFGVRTDAFDADAVREMQVAKRSDKPDQTRRPGRRRGGQGVQGPKTQLEQDVSVANKAGL